MQWTDSLILGITQGISEFLPISSSAHLIIAEKLLGLKLETLKSFDVALHVATLLAILIYFWKDVLGVLNAILSFITGKKNSNDPYTKLIPLLVIGTIPAVILGFTAGDALDATFRNTTSIAILLIVVGLFFVLAEWIYKKRVKKSEISVGNALVIGLAQAAALIPGVSRSGATISVGLTQGFARSEVARFSFLLGIPAMFGAGLLTFVDLSPVEVAEMDYVSLGVGFVSAFVSGLLCVSLLMKFLKKYSLTVFAVYRILLGVGILVFL